MARASWADDQGCGQSAKTSADRGWSCAWLPTLQPRASRDRSRRYGYDTHGQSLVRLQCQPDGIRCRRVHQTIRLRYFDTVLEFTVVGVLVASDATPASLDALRHTRNNMVRRASGLYEGEQMTWVQYHERRRQRFASPPPPQPRTQRAGSRRDSTQAGRAESGRCKQTVVHQEVRREGAQSDEEGHVVQVKRARMNKGKVETQEQARRKLAQEIDDGEIMDELFAGTLFSIVVEMLIYKLMSSNDRLSLRVLGVSCASLLWLMRWRVFADLPEEDLVSKEKQKIGRLGKAMYGMRGAPPPSDLFGEGQARDGQDRILHGVIAPFGVDVDDFLCLGPWEELEQLYQPSKQVHDLHNTKPRGGGALFE